VALARAIVFEPRALLLDEPLSALDRRLRATLQLEIRRIHRELGATFIFVTHDRDLVADAATRVLALSKHGADDFQGPYEEFLRKVGEVRLDR
jgi:putative spermidine/putrescine transport system ATP-binding protein